MTQATRQAITLHGLNTRLEDAALASLSDKRGRQGRRLSFKALMLALMYGLATASRSLREVEELTSSLTRRVRRASGIGQRISDTKLRDTLLQLDAEQVRVALHRQIKAEHRRGQLRRDGLPISLLAIDGKGLGKLNDWGHPNIQKVEPSQGLPYGLARAHRAVLVSSQAAVCVDTRPIPGDTNEIGAMPGYIEELHETYGRTTLFDTIIADAGNTSEGVARRLAELNYGYILAIKENHGELHLEAQRQLTNAKVQHEFSSQERGQQITYRLYRHRLDTGYLNWTHARQVVRVERLVNGEEQCSEGNRFYVSNLPWNRLSEQQWLKSIRAYWRIENNSNWTADAFWREDAKRTPWTTDPEAVYVMAALRMLAINIVAVMRAGSRQPGMLQGKLPWHIALRHMVTQLTAQADTGPDVDIACV